MIKKVLINVFIIACTSLIILSCKNDDDSEGLTNYSFDVILGLSEFIIVTNQNKEELYNSTSVTSQLTSIQFDADPEDTIDVTYGRSNFLEIYTYRNVSQDFSIGFERSLFDSVKDRTGPFGNQIFEITGLEGHIVTNPLSGVFIEEDKTIIRGIGYLGNYSFSVYDEKDNQYKSFVIREENWIPQGNTDYLVRAHIDDFVVADRHVIDLNQTSTAWKICALANQTDGFPVILDMHNRGFDSSTNLQEGDQVEIFIPSNLDFTTIDLKIMSNNIKEGFDYNERGLIDIPENISFKEINPSYLLFNSREYNVQNDEAFDMVKMTYAFDVIGNSLRSFWHVYQKSQDTIAYDLPRLPTEFLSTNSVGNTLEQPLYLLSQYYQLENPLNEDGFEENVGERIDLQNFNLSYKSADF